MEFIAEELLQYCEQHSQQESELLHDLNRQTHLKVMSPRMLSGHLQGRLLSFLSKMIAPSFILEIGTYTGYSALCLAEGLKPDGKLVTIDPNEETNAFAQTFFNRSIYCHQIQSITGKAAEIIPTIDKEVNIAFVDADKKSYATYYELIIPKLSTGGLLIADNVLWSVKVVSAASDADTLAMRAFNAMVAADTRVESLMLPVRDGLTIVRKR